MINLQNMPVIPLVSPSPDYKRTCSLKLLIVAVYHKTIRTISNELLTMIPTELCSVIIESALHVHYCYQPIRSKAHAFLSCLASYQQQTKKGKNKVGVRYVLKLYGYKARRSSRWKPRSQSDTIS